MKRGATAALQLPSCTIMTRPVLQLNQPPEKLAGSLPPCCPCWWLLPVMPGEADEQLRCCRRAPEQLMEGEAAAVGQQDGLHEEAPYQTRGAGGNAQALHQLPVGWRSTMMATSCRQRV
jgi:hypothetical protein